MEIIYLLGVAYLYANECLAGSYRIRYRVPARHRCSRQKHRNDYRQSMKLAKPASQPSFEAFVNDLESQQGRPIATGRRGHRAPAKKLPGYAGSETCGRCHVDIYRQWSQSGMAKMLRPYQPQNVIGDFEKNNRVLCRRRYPSTGTANCRPRSGNDRALFARMVIRGGRHYFDIIGVRRPLALLSQSTTPSVRNGSRPMPPNYPTDRSTFFPFNTAPSQSKWLDYWKVIDSAAQRACRSRQTWERLDGFNELRV